MKPYYDLFQFNRNQFQKMAMTLVLCLAIQVVYAGSYTWNGSQSTAWSASANWTPNGVPSTNDTVTISNGNVSSILLDGNRTITRLVISANTIDLNTYELYVSGRSSLNGGSISNGNLKLRGTYAFFQGTNFYCVMDVIAGQLKFSGGVFDQGGNFEQTGTASGFGDGGCTFNGNVTLKNSGATVLRMGQINDDIFNGDVTYTCTGISALQPSYSDSTFYNGNVYLNNTGSGGIVFCNGTSGVGVLANGKIIGVGTTGLTAGVNTLKNILQNGSTAQSITTTSTLNITACTFNGSTTLTAAGILVKGSTFNSSSTFTKTGNANNYWDGANVFNGTTTINNNTTGNGVLRMALQSGDVYAGDVNFNTSTGPLQVAFSGNSEFRGNVNINHSKVVFNAGSGTVLCTGSTAQQWSGSADFAIGKLTLNKSANDITLQRATTIDSSLTLTSGIIYTDSINLVTLKAVSICSGGSSLSYINGPMVRYGASSFTYPIGSDLKFRPISVSASNLSTDALKMQFFNSAPLNSSTCDTTIRLGSCENWKVVYVSNSKSRIFTISWDSLSCGVPRNYDIIVAGWNGATWKNLGRSNISGGYLNGTANSNDSSASTSICLGTLKNNLTIDSVQFGELLDYSIYTRDSILLNEQIGSIGKVGADYINRIVSTSDSVLTNYSGSTATASNSLIYLLETLNSLTEIPLDTTYLNFGTLPSGIYEIITDLNINIPIVLDSLNRYIFFVKGKLILGSNCAFSSKFNPSKNVLFITDSVIADKNAFVSASFISFNEFTQIGEMSSSKLSIFAPNNILIRNDSTEFLQYAIYFDPNFKYQNFPCSNVPEGCNLVLNAGFSEEISTPTWWGGISNNNCCNWASANAWPGTPDYFHSSAGSPNPFGCPTQNDATWNASQNDHGIYGSGIPAYAGLYTINPASFNKREYIQGNLSTTLTNQKKYYGEFYASLMDISRYSANKLGMYVSQLAPFSPDPAGFLTNITPQIEHDPIFQTQITGINTWTLINGCFEANGNENFITIGNFNDDNNTTSSLVIPQPTTVHTFNVAYYLIDDVSVFPIEVSAGPDVTVECLGSVTLGANNCLENLNPGIFTYSWSLISGSLAFGSLSAPDVQFPLFTNSNSSPITQTLVYQVQISTPGGCTAIDQVSITCDPMLTNATSTFIGNTISNQTLNIIGNLTVDQDLVIDNCNLIMGQNSRILVNDGFNLTITSSVPGSNSHLFACQDMWQGIVLLGSGSSLIINSHTLVEDAITAVFANQSPAININNSFFRNNFRGIELVSHLIVNNVTIEENEFNTVALLRAPFIGSYSDAHIKLLEVGHLNISQNKFYGNCDYGIYAIATNFTAQSNFFSNYSTKKGSSGIFAGTASSYTAYENIFDGVNFGCNSLNSTSAEIGPNNEFKNLLAGIRAFNCKYKTLNYFQNSFENIRGYGIYNFNNLISTQTIKDNVFINGGNKATAIVVAEVVAPTIKNGTFIIEGNSITNFEAGIDLSNLNAPQVKGENEITLKNAPINSAFTQIGIAVKNCYRAIVKYNIVSSPVAFASNSRGILINKSDQSFVACNTVSNVERGIMWQNLSANSKMLGNDMTNCYDHLYLKDNPGLGYQYATIVVGQADIDVPSDNKWQWPNFNSHTFSDLSNDGIGTEFEVRSNWTPDVGAINISNPNNATYVPVSYNNVNYSGPVFCTLLSTSKVNFDQEQLIAENIVYDYFAEENENWQSKLYLYRELLKDTALLNSDTIMVNQKDSLESTSLAALDIVSTSLFSIITDTLLSEFQKDSALIELAVVNSEIGTAILIEDLEKQINNFIIEKMSRDSIGISEEDRDFLESIAFICTRKGGNAVFIAWTLLSLLDSTSNSYNDSCSQQGARIRNTEESSSANIQIIVQPNPANDYILISIVGESEYNNFDFEILNNDGKLVERNSSITTQQVRVNSAKYANGIYSIKVNIKGKSLTSKFIITH